MARPGDQTYKPPPVGTANVDALSRRGERYSIKGILNAKKTGTVYPDSKNTDKQLFKYMLIVKLDRDWSLQAITGKAVPVLFALHIFLDQYNG
jgi:hypothetical protein